MSDIPAGSLWESPVSFGYARLRVVLEDDLGHRTRRRQLYVDAVNLLDLSGKPRVELGRARLNRLHHSGRIVSLEENVDEVAHRCALQRNYLT